MKPINKTRITFDFTFEIDGERRKCYEKLAQIVCSSHWGSGIDIFGFINQDHRLFFEFVEKGVIVIDECEIVVIHISDQPLHKSQKLRHIRVRRSHGNHIYRDSLHQVVKHIIVVYSSVPILLGKYNDVSKVSHDEPLRSSQKW